MLVPTLVMVLIAVGLLFVGYIKDGDLHVAGLKMAGNMLINIFPLLVCAFIVAGMVQVLLPKEVLSQWIGTESGMKGIFIGTAMGAFSPGGPYVTLPIAATLLRSGAGIGTCVAFLTGWSLWSVLRLPMEVGILGWKVTFIRFLSVLIFPPIAGILAQFLSKFLK